MKLIITLLTISFTALTIQNNNAVSVAQHLNADFNYVRFWNNTAHNELVLYFIEQKTANYIVLQNTVLKNDFADGKYLIKMLDYGLEITARNGQAYFFSVNNGYNREGANNFVKQNDLKKYDLNLTWIHHYYGNLDTYKTLDELKKEYPKALDYFENME